ncbi:MAG: hypothetical protein JKY49_00480 [Cohaesibacteraceae bacterium]|nr:hypothetical protein [Cohaesibacteraceae bacterium]MBL4876190.1 hypothetical protein [Cohaesibacteraceae bacterium]
MTDIITPTSLLNAVNTVLGSLSESPVSSLSQDALPLDASMALDLINETSRETQKKGWQWNRECHRLTPDTDKFIQLPTNTLEIKPIGNSGHVPVTLRSGRVYNMTPFKHSFEFEDLIELELTLALPFEDLPESCRRYVALKASWVFQGRHLGDEQQSQSLGRAITEAWNDLHNEEHENHPVSMANSSIIRDM